MRQDSFTCIVCSSASERESASRCLTRCSVTTTGYAGCWKPAMPCLKHIFWRHEGGKNEDWKTGIGTMLWEEETPTGWTKAQEVSCSGEWGLATLSNRTSSPARLRGPYIHCHGPWLPCPPRNSTRRQGEVEARLETLRRLPIPEESRSSLPNYRVLSKAWKCSIKPTCCSKTGSPSTHISNFCFGRTSLACQQVQIPARLASRFAKRARRLFPLGSPFRSASKRPPELSNR